MKHAGIVIGTVSAVCAATVLYGYANYSYSPRSASPVGSPNSVPAVARPTPFQPGSLPVPTSSSTAEKPAPVTPHALYQRCVRGGFPTYEDAEWRNAVCTRAIETHALTPDQLALVHLVRGSARMVLGAEAVGGDDYTDALKRYDSMFNWKNAEALDFFRRAAAEDAHGNTEKALDLYSKAVRLDSSTTLAFLERGIALAAHRRAYERAISDFDEVLALQPGNVLALIRRGQAFSQLGQTARGLVDLDHAIALSPSSSQAYFYRGLIHGRRNDTAAALEDYDAALQRNPHNVHALASRAAIHAGQGELGLAIRDLDAAISIDDRNPVAFYNRGYVHFANAEYRKALDDYTAAIDLDENFGLAYNNRCLMRTILRQDRMKVQADCDVALRLMPLNLDVRDTRGFVFLALGDPALALNEYSIVLEKDPNRATALFGRGLARIRTGDVAGGEADQAAARRINHRIDHEFGSYRLN